MNVRRVIVNNPHMLVPWYLMSSYMYYKNNKNIISDTDFDWICSKLYDKWDTVEHLHKSLIHKESLKAGTGYHIRSYPDRVKSAAMLYWQKYCKGK